MAVSINGNTGVVTGIAVGGLPDGIVDTDMLASGAVTAAKRGAGAILQVVNVEKTDVASTTSSSYTDISGMSASITPSSSSNKILVSVFVPQYVAPDIIHIVLCTGDGTSILQGSTVSGKESMTIGAYSGNNSIGEAWYGTNPATIVKLHSPNTTSSVTYKLRWKINNSTGYLNRNQSDGSQYAMRCASTITLMEIAA